MDRESKEKEPATAEAASAATEGFRTFDHTGDLGLEVWAGSPARLYGLAAEALMAQVVEAPAGEAGVEERLALTGDDPADLLVHWLNSVLLHGSLRNAVWTRATIRSWSPRSIEATLEGHRIDPKRHVLLREVKAVSHHHLALEIGPSRYWCRLVLDI